MSECKKPMQDSGSNVLGVQQNGTCGRQLPDEAAEVSIEKRRREQRRQQDPSHEQLEYQ